MANLSVDRLRISCDFLHFEVVAAVAFGFSRCPISLPSLFVCLKPILCSQVKCAASLVRGLPTCCNTFTAFDAKELARVVRQKAHNISVSERSIGESRLTRV